MKLGDVLKFMRAEEGTFSLSWVTCDQTRKTGGQIRELAGLQVGKGEKETLSKKLLTDGSKRRSYAQDTINLYHPETGKHVRIHKRLILMFNEHNVTY